MTVGHAETIGHKGCFDEVLDTLQDTYTLLNCTGISLAFLEYLPNIKIVAGDLPQTQEFIAKYNDVESRFMSVYASVKQDAAKVEITDQAESSALCLFPSIISTLVLLAITFY